MQQDHRSWILKYAAHRTYVTEHENTQLKHQKFCSTKAWGGQNLGYVRVGAFLIRFRLTEVQILAVLWPPGAGRVQLRLPQAPLPPAPLQQCRTQDWALPAPGAAFKHAPGAPQVLESP